MTRKRLEKEERKDQIKKAAIALITERGYKKTSVQDIVDKARFSKGGFYNCYRSKDELFKEILQDGMDYRNNQVLKYKHDMIRDRKSFMIEALLDKILDYNDYKKMVCALIAEASHNEDFMQLYMDTTAGYRDYFTAFCKQEGFEEYIKINNVEFGLFIVSLIVGNDIFNQCGNEKFRDMMRDIISAYFEKIGLFE